MNSRPMLTLPLVTCLVGISLARAVEISDPAEKIITFKLTDEEEKTCRLDFEKLASDDFDVRERALERLIARGPAVLSLAQLFVKHTDPEIAAKARSLHQRILLTYDGYLPTSPTLKAGLAKQVEYSLNSRENLLLSLQKIAADAGIELFIDPSIGAREISPLVELQNEQELPAKACAGQALAIVLQLGQLAGVPRGNVFVVTTPDTARRLSTHRHTFDWGDLGLSRDEAERVTQLLTPFFPAHSTEIHSGIEPFVIRGEEEALRRAARMLALLKPGASDALFPAPTALTAAAVSLIENVSTPATVILSAEDPLNSIAQLKRQGLDVFCADNTPEANVFQEPPFPSDARGASPLRLALHNQPLGLVLRWIERRAKFPAAEQSELILGYEINDSRRIQFRLQPKSRLVLQTALLGADVTFLYPRGAKLGAESDIAAKAAFLEAIDSHLSLFPRYSTAHDIAVVRGRLFMQGDYGTAVRTLELVREWRAKGAPPAPAAWKTALETRLNTPVDWDGRGLTAGRLLQTLRKLGNIDILLEDAPDGTAPSFHLTAKDAELLPPGKHTLRALLDKLVVKTNAIWKVELGVVVLTPKSDGK